MKDTKKKTNITSVFVLVLNVHVFICFIHDPKKKHTQKNTIFMHVCICAHVC